MLNWLNIELTNRCNKSCHFCGRAKARKNEEMELGEMPLEFINEIAKQFKGNIVQFNKDGEPLLYYNLWVVGELFRDKITNIVTNGKLLYEKRTALIDNFTTITVSVFEDDEEQKESIMKFADYCNGHAPNILIKYLGKYSDTDYNRFTVLNRSIHNSMFDVGFQGSKPPVPELGVCLDFLMKPSIDWRGDIYICNRYDPEGLGKIGSTFTESLEQLWNSEKRKNWLELHKQGKRKEIPLCQSCEFWGIPTNG